MKKILTALVFALTLTACGSDDSKPNTQAEPTVRIAWADLTPNQPEADIGYEGCRLQTNLTEVNGRTETAVTLDGTVLTYRYDTQDGAFYLSEDGTRSLQVYERQSVARVGITCPL